MPTRILALDTATEACSAALMLDNKLFLEKFSVVPREHTKHILPMVNSLLEEANITLGDLDALAFSCGPGSFTGIRIGMGIAQGLALGANLPLIAISTLLTLAEGAWRQTGAHQVLSLIDARMGEVYWAAYRRKGNAWLSEKKESVMSPHVLATMNLNLKGCWATAGTGWKTYPELLRHKDLQLIPGNTLFPSARDMLPLAVYRYRYSSTKPIALVEPCYLRNKVARKNMSSASK